MTYELTVPYWVGWLWWALWPLLPVAGGLTFAVLYETFGGGGDYDPTSALVGCLCVVLTLGLYIGRCAS